MNEELIGCIEAQSKRLGEIADELGRDDLDHSAIAALIEEGSELVKSSAGGLEELLSGLDS